MFATKATDKDEFATRTCKVNLESLLKISQENTVLELLLFKDLVLTLVLVQN